MAEKKPPKHTLDELKIMQALPLPLKIQKTQLRITECVRQYGLENCYVSFSGGKDSTVLLDITRKIFPDMEALFCDTGLEYPEVKKFVKSFPNVKTVYPTKTFKKVFCEYGYPVISKAVSHNVAIARRHPEGRVMKNAFNPEKYGRYAMHKWLPLVYVDFLITDKCCEYTKKSAFKKLDKVPIIATMAEESILRKDNWLHYGCNAFDAEYPKSSPLSFWTEQDILKYCYEYNLPLCESYGDVVMTEIKPKTILKKENASAFSLICKDIGMSDADIDDLFGQMRICEYCTTKEKRTGCIYCPYGCHLEKGQTRFQRLKETHPKIYNYCIYGGAYDTEDGLWKPDKNGLGMKHVFDTLNSIYGENFIRYK